MTIYDASDTEFTTVRVPEEGEDGRDLMFAIRELLKARPAYQEAHEFYECDFTEYFASQEIQKKLEGSGEYYKFRLAKLPVTVLANRVKLNSIKVDKSAQEIWDDIWDANDMKVHAPMVTERTFEFGDAYLHVWPSYDDEDGEAQEEGTEIEEVESGVTLTYNSPWNTRMIYDEQDQRRALYAIMYWKSGKHMRADLHYRDRIEHYRTVQPHGKGLQWQDWEEYAEELRYVVGAEIKTRQIPAVEDNEYDEIMIKHARNHFPYGKPEHRDAFGPQRAISKHLITEISGVDDIGWPLRVALAEANASLDTANDSTVWDDDTKATAKQSKMSGSIKTRPGSLAWLDGVKDVKEFTGGDPSFFTEPVELYVSLMSTLTGTPLYEFKPGGEQPSGKARRIADGPLEARKTNRQDWLEGFWKEVVRAALKVVDVETEVVEVQWAPSVMAEDKDDWEVIKAMLSAGVPFEYVMTQFGGYDMETVRKWAPKDMGLLEGAEALTKVGEAVTQLGSGVSAGIMTAEQANEIVQKMLASKMGIKLDWEEVEKANEEREAKEEAIRTEEMDLQREKVKQGGAGQVVRPSTGKVGGTPNGARPTAGKRP